MRAGKRIAVSLLAVIVIAAMTAGFAHPDNAYAKTRYLTVKSVCAGKTVKGATFDVYRGKKRIANNVKYFRKKVRKGKTYTIKDIRPKAAYVYKGKKTIKVKIYNKSRRVSLKLAKRQRSFTVAAASGFEGKITFDVTIGGKKKANDVTAYSGKITSGTKWSVTDIKSSDPHITGLAQQSGTAGTSSVSVKISASRTAHDKDGAIRLASEPTFEEPGSQWKTCSVCGADMEEIVTPAYTGGLEFSKEAGAYQDQAIPLGITSEDGLDVIYTTDGSIPDMDSSKTKTISGDISIVGDMNSGLIEDLNGQLLNLGDYDKPMTVSGNGIPTACVIRAAAVLPDGTVGPVSTKTYFPGTDIQDDFGVVVISLTCAPDDLLDPDKGIMALGKMFNANIGYNNSVIDAGTPWKVIANYTQKGRAWERPANIEVFDGTDRVSYENGCGLRLQGTSSRRLSQKSFNIYFRGDYGKKNMKYELLPENKDSTGATINKYKKFALRSGGNDAEAAKYRNVMLQEMMEGMDFETQKGRRAVVFLNGEFYGLVALNEKYSKEMIESHYGIDEDDVIIMDKGEVEDAVDEEFALSNFREMRALFDKDLSVEDNYNALCKAVDVQSLADYYAAKIYVSETDWKELEWTNTRMWRTVTEDGAAPQDGKWRMMMFDVEFCAGLYGMEQNAADYDMVEYLKTAVSDQPDNYGQYLYPLFRSVMRNPQFRTLLAESLRNVADKMTYDKFDTVITKWVDNDRTRTLMSMNRARFGYPKIEGQYDALATDVTNLRTFFSQRPGMVNQMLDEIEQPENWQY